MAGIVTTNDSICPLCGEQNVSNMSLHYRICEKVNSTSDSEDTKVEQKDTYTEKVKVKFTWKSLTGMSYRSVTLLSAFQQSIELNLDYDGMKYSSQWINVPVGEFDGQIVIGSSFCYPVKKFVIDQEGETVQLDLDLSKMDCDHDHEGDSQTSYGRYSDYSTAYNTSHGEDSDLTMQYNPAYQSHDHVTYLSHYSDQSYLGGSAGGKGRKVYAMYMFPTDTGGEDTCMHDPTTVRYVSKERPQITSHKNTSLPMIENPLGEDISRQLSEEGFTPVTVRSKVKETGKTASPSTYVKPEQTSLKPQSLITQSNTSSSVTSKRRVAPDPPISPSPQEPHSSSSMPHTNTSVPHTKQNRNPEDNNSRFAVSNIQGSGIKDESVDQLRQDRDRFKSDLERVSAQLQGRIKRLQERLSQYEESKEPKDLNYDSGGEEHIIELEELIEKLKTDLEDQQSLVDFKERELVEVKDRTTALENQLMEYAGTIQDQGKVIHNMSHHGHGHGEGQYAKLQELYTYATEFTKKQQVEFQEKITYFEKKIERNRNLEEENMVLHDTCDKLTKDIEQHRSQTKQLLRDIESKRKEADKLREKLKNGDQSKSFSERDVLEMETLKQKFEGWKECAERSSEELEVAKIQLKQLEQERDSLSHELQILSESTISDKDAGFTKISKLQKQLKDLQDLRVKQERDLGTLRAEKTQILEHNAELVETSNPEKYTKLKQEVTRLHTQNKELESQLRQAKQNLKLHEEHNLELQKHLEATSNPEILQTIQQKIQKYKQERDTARELVKQVKITSVDSDQQHELVLQTLEGELAEWKMEVAKMKQILAEQKAKKKKYRDNCHQLEGLRKDLLMELQEKEDTIISLQSLLDHHGNKDYEEEMDTVEQGEEWRSYKGDRPMGVSYTETSSSPPRIVSPHSFEIRTLPHRTSHGEDLVDIEPTHSLPRDLTKGYKFETSTIVDTNLGMSPSSHSFSPTPVKSKTPRNSSRKQVIDNISHHGHGHGEGQYAKLQELYTHATEFTKKQQVEFQEKITYFEKKIERNRNLEEENMVLHDTCDKLTKDIEQYRSQTIQLLRDIESKKKEADNLREKLKSGEYSRSFVEFEHLELQEKEVEGGIYSKKLLCRTVGCGFYGIRENDGLCKDCYEKYYMKGLLLPHAIPHGNY